MSKLTKEEFKKLQTEWYQKLQDSGFKDLEERFENPLCLRIQDRADYYFKRLAPHKRKDKEEYFNVLTAIVYNPSTQFKNPTDKFILYAYVEGHRISAIIKSLAQLGVLRNRKTIRILIRRYEMRWHLRKYTRKQLNLRELND